MTSEKNITNNAEEVTANEKTPKEAFIDYLECESDLSEYIIGDDRKAALTLRVRTNPKDYIEVLILIFSKEENKIIDKEIFELRKKTAIKDFVNNYIDAAAIKGDMSTEALLTYAMNKKCIYHYKDGVLGNDETDYRKKLFESTNNKEGLAAQLEDCEHSIKVWFNDSDLEKVTFTQLKGYVGIKKEDIDKIFGKDKIKIYKLLSEKGILYNSVSGRYGYRDRSNDKDIMYIAVSQEFLNGGENNA